MNMNKDNDKDNEFKILIDLHTIISDNIEHLNNTKNRISNIKKRINGVNNTYFNMYGTFLVDMLSNETKDDYDNSLKYFEEIKTHIETKIQTLCKHEWANDYIDLDPDKSCNICYCIKCEVTKI